jgi:hypothetical protein
VRKWTSFVVAAGLAWGIWAAAATQGYGWEMLWLPGAVAGAAWPR